MIEIDPADSASYRRNYMALAATLDSCDRVISSRLKPVGHATFMVWHPSLSYFAEDYRLHQLSIGMDNKEIAGELFLAEGTVRNNISTGSIMRKSRGPRCFSCSLISMPAVPWQSLPGREREALPSILFPTICRRNFYA